MLPPLGLLDDEQIADFKTFEHLNMGVAFKTDLYILFYLHAVNQYVYIFPAKVGVYAGTGDNDDVFP